MHDKGFCWIGGLAPDGKLGTFYIGTCLKRRTTHIYLLLGHWSGTLQRGSIKRPGRFADQNAQCQHALIVHTEFTR
jgi:hypothetical protein